MKKALQTTAKAILTVTFCTAAVVMLGWHSFPVFLAALTVCGLSAKALKVLKAF